MEYTGKTQITIAWPIDIDDDCEILAWIRSNTFKRYPSGSCKIGIKGDSVVDSCFKVHGTCGLYIVDSSIYPISPDCEPELFTCAIARCAAFVLSEKCNKKKKDTETPRYSTCRKIKCGGCGSNKCKIEIMENDKSDACGGEDCRTSDSDSDFSSCALSEPKKKKKGCKKCT